MRDEVEGVSSLAHTLRDELEKRLAELVQVRQERDQVQAVKEQVEQCIADKDKEVSRMNEMFKRTLESERNKMKQELQARAGRIQVLEGEKQELLHDS